MTTSPTDGARTARPSRREALTSRRFVVHYLQMLAAMLAGMVLLMPVSMLIGVDAGVELQALLMATSMSVGMAALMLWHRSPVSSIVEMCLVMYLSFAVLLPAFWLGLLSGGAVIGLGHVVMLPAMAAVMLRRREQYLAHTSQPG
jgi:flagellar biosynthetic protein FliP